MKGGFGLRASITVNAMITARKLMVTADFSRGRIGRDKATTSEPSADSASTNVATISAAAMAQVISTADKGSVSRS